MHRIRPFIIPFNIVTDKICDGRQPHGGGGGGCLCVGWCWSVPAVIQSTVVKSPENGGEKNSGS